MMKYLDITADNEFKGLWQLKKEYTICEVINGDERIRAAYTDPGKRTMFIEKEEDGSLTIFKLIQTTNTTDFTAGAKSYVLDDGVYTTLNPIAENEAFEMEMDGMPLRHWEYENGKGGIFQIIAYPGTDVLDLFTGISIRSEDYR